ncbi:tetratricopeptide repeat protein [Rhizobium sp. ZW T2_16]|jgi:TPR repeat protein|uniref:tetratricopeptide repeat protein n=1 Tax=Rhizobium sp. ZW T2_16 TaxID=3378083 RepID=UPI0038547A41
MRWLDRLRGKAAETAADTVSVEMERALAAANAGDYETALALWEPLARAGNARAQNNIGACFAEGLGVASDRPLALKWLTLSAEAGDPVGQRNCAAFYMQGSDAIGSDADPARAAKLYRLAAEQGDAPAQDMLSWLLLEGEIIPSDPAEAKSWAEQAAEAGIAASMTRLGMLYHNALGVERDPAQAVYWWRKGAAGDDADAQAMLGAAYHMGAGMPADRVDALAWLLRALNGGSALAQPFLNAARENLTLAETTEAERRAKLPLSEIIAARGKS